MESINFEQFCEKYKIRRNPIKQLSPYDNTMLDMDDEELDYLESHNEKKVWSLVEHDRKIVLKPGLYYKDVIGYFVSENEWQDKERMYLI